jgi:hypothetical protein
MKSDLAIWSAASAGSFLLLSACGGAAQPALPGDSGGPITPASDSGSPNASSPSGGADAAAINPGAIGGILAGMGADDAGEAIFLDSGSSAMPSTPQVVDGCNQLCTKEVGAACPAGPTLDSCLVGCRVILANPNCASAGQGLFSCVQTAAASCDTSGNVVFAGCQVQQLAADLCFLQGANDPGLTTPCTTYCASVAAANCPSDAPSGCQSGCQVIGNLVPGCDTPWKNYVTCANGSTLTCGSNGKAGAPACASQALGFWACAAGGLATILSDGGK